MTSGSEAGRGREPIKIARRLLIAAVGVFGVGVAGAIAGVIAPVLFVPATWVIALGLLGAAVAGIFGSFGARAGGS